MCVRERERERGKGGRGEGGKEGGTESEVGEGMSERGARER